MSEEKYLRERKFWLVMPVLIVPIVTIFFWLMGGGSGEVSASGKNSGLNMKLPDARAPKDSVADKLSFYDAADADSSKRVEQLRMDPYRKDTTASVALVKKTVHVRTEPDELSMKIAAIQKRIAAPERVYEEPEPVVQVARKNVAPDPEMEAINMTLDKLMAIQNPQQNKAKGVVEDKHSFSVSSVVGDDESFFGKRSVKNTENIFHGDAENSRQKKSGIIALIPTEQILQNGSLVKIELKSAVTINGISLPAGTNVFGVANLDGERMFIRIPSVRYQDKILPVALTVFDLDGLEGIYVQGSIARDVVKSSADNAVQSVGVNGFDLKTQAAAAGISAAKGLLSKKVKQVRVTLSAGYNVLLVDTKL
jgi:conjugative transposon TraM protein